MPEIHTDSTTRVTIDGIEHDQRIRLDLVPVAAPPPNPQPKILSFAANRSVIQPGEAVTLSWVTEGADRVYLNGANMEGAFFVVSPTATTTYTLRVEDDAGEWPIDSATVTVTVEEPAPPPPPDPVPDGPSDVRISVLQSSLAINPGETVRLNYGFTNCSAAWLTTEVGPIGLDPVQGTVDVGPFLFSSSFPLTALDMQGRPAIEPLSVVVRDVAPSPSTTRQAPDSAWPADTTEADAVLIPEGQSVSLTGRRAVAGAVMVAGELALTDAVLYAAWVHVMPTGKLLLDGLSKKSLIVLRNCPQSQLLVEGRMVTRGKPRTHCLRLSQPAKKGDRAIHLESAPIGWEIGHKIRLPTCSYRKPDQGTRFLEGETAVVRYVDGSTVYLLHPLQFDHAYHWQEAEVYHLITSTGVIASDPLDVNTRGHAHFTGTENSVENCVFHGLGRRRNQGLNKDHLTPLSPVHLDGLDASSSFRNCVSLEPHPLIPHSPVCWGFDLDGCVGMEFVNNISFNWFGWGICVRGGQGIKFYGNRSHWIDGTGALGNQKPMGVEGAGLGLMDGKNGPGVFSHDIVDFRSSDTRKYCFNAFSSVSWTGPFGRFEDVCGLTSDLGGTWWSIGAVPSDPLPASDRVTILRSRMIATGQQAFYSYASARVDLIDPYFANCKTAIYGGDYCHYDYEARGLRMGPNGGAIVLSPFTNSTGHHQPLQPVLPQRFIDIDLGPHGLFALVPRAGSGNFGHYGDAIYHCWDIRGGAPKLFDSSLEPDRFQPSYFNLEDLQVWGVNGDGKHYRLWRPESMAGYVHPAKFYFYDLAGSKISTAGLTNRQSLEQYGVCVSGAIAPEGITTRPWSGNMLVEDLS